MQQESNLLPHLWLATDDGDAVEAKRLTRKLEAVSVLLWLTPSERDYNSHRIGSNFRQRNEAQKLIGKDEYE